MSLYIASDHGGFELKNYITSVLQSLNIPIEDLGPYKFAPTDDYTDYAVPLAKKVSTDKKNKGILICRNGVGEAIAANKVKGIRCGLSWTAQHVKSARNDDDINILALPADYIKKEDAIDIVSTFLNTQASTEKRHTRRRDKLMDIEND